MRNQTPEINSNKIQHHRSGEKYCTCIAQNDWEKDLTPKRTYDEMQLITDEKCCTCIV